MAPWVRSGTIPPSPNFQNPNIQICETFFNVDPYEAPVATSEVINFVTVAAPVTARTRPLYLYALGVELGSSQLGEDQ